MFCADAQRGLAQVFGVAFSVLTVSIFSAGINSLKKKLFSSKRIDPNQCALKQGSSAK
jgi:hypothetical protein